MIGLPAGTRVWLVAGITDMRCGFNGLAAKVQTALAENPFSGHVFLFRGRLEYHHSTTNITTPSRPAWYSCEGCRAN